MSYMAKAGKTHVDQFALYKGKETVVRQIIESTSGSLGSEGLFPELITHS